MGALEPGDGDVTEADLAEHPAQAGEDVDDRDEEEFGAERELCQDETCVGIVNLEGVCGDCGTAASIAANQGQSRSKRESTGQGRPVDFMHRSLCPDGACIGVVGPDGRCKACGLVAESVLTDPRLRGLKPPAIEDSGDGDFEAGDNGSEVDDADGVDADRVNADEPAKDPGHGGIEIMATAKEFADRQLCPDGSCIGVIGPAGTCKECGSAA